MNHHFLISLNLIMAGVLKGAELNQMFLEDERSSMYVLLLRSHES
jgi:hypothetical protein